MRSWHTACAAIAWLLLVLPGAARAQPSVVRRWEPGARSAVAWRHAVLDPASELVIAMEEQPSQRASRGVRHRLVARRIADGSTRWTSSRAAVPLTVEGGFLIALREARAASDVVLLDVRAGRSLHVCSGATLLVDEGPGHSETVSAVRFAGALYLVARSRASYAGGVHPRPGEERTTRNERYFALSIAGTRCTLGEVPSPFPPPNTGSTTLARRRDGHEWVFSVTLSNGTEVTLGRSEEPSAAMVSLDESYVALVTSVGSSSVAMHAVFFDARTGARVFEGDAEGSPFAFVGSRIVAELGPTLLVSDGTTGRAVFRVTPASLERPRTAPP